MIPKYEDAAARSARHRDVMISGLVAGAALIIMFIMTGEKRWGPIYVVAMLSAGVTNTVLDARRAGWRWGQPRRFLFWTLVVTALGYGIWWFLYT